MSRVRVDDSAPASWTHDDMEIGLDEVSVCTGHTNCIVVSDLVRRPPVWFGGADRANAILNEFA